MLTSLCECGCGEQTKSGNRFIRWHNNRVFTDATRKKMSETQKRIRLDPNCIFNSEEVRKKISNGNKGKITSIETKEKLSKVLKWDKKRREKHLQYWTPERRLEWSKMTSTRWANGVYDDSLWLNSNNHWSTYTVYNGIQMRSKLEARTAKVMHENNILYEYEPRGYKLIDNRTYYPDFYLPEFDTYLDPKGWEQNLDKIQLFKEMGNTILLVRDDDLEGLETELMFKVLDGINVLLTQEEMKSDSVLFLNTNQALKLE